MFVFLLVPGRAFGDVQVVQEVKRLQNGVSSRLGW